MATSFIAIAAMIILRSPLSDVIKRISEIRFRGARVTIQQLTERTEALEVGGEDPAPRTFGVETDARITILASWASVERAIAELAKSRHLRPRSTQRLIEQLRKAGIIDYSLASILRDMGSMRNFIAHSEDLSNQYLDTGTVQHYVEAAARLELTVERLKEQETDP